MASAPQQAASLDDETRSHPARRSGSRRPAPGQPYSMSGAASAARTQNLVEELGGLAAGQRVDHEQEAQRRGLDALRPRLVLRLADAALQVPAAQQRRAGHILRERGLVTPDCWRIGPLAAQAGAACSGSLDDHERLPAHGLDGGYQLRPRSRLLQQLKLLGGDGARATFLLLHHTAGCSGHSQHNPRAAGRHAGRNYGV